ncbi:MAG: hypothetical protein ABUL72_01055, partial [Armatimonadota bacterium]
VMNQVTGMGVWTALRSAVPIAFDEGTFVLGLDGKDQELAGHLCMAQPKRAMADTLARFLNEKVQVRIIPGIELNDWVTEKKRDAEKRRLQEEALNRQRKEIASGMTWDKVYEQLSRAYAGLANRSLPQSRAKFFMMAIDIVAEALVETPINDDMAERNYARCLERIAQYTEVSSTFVALKVLEKTFGG